MSRGDMNTRWLPSDQLIGLGMTQILPVNTVLDIGVCVKPQEYIPCTIHICVEPFKEYMDYLNNVLNLTHPIYDHHHILLQMTWQEVVKYFPSKSVDTVFLGDVIEHLDKEEGKHLLQATENIAKRQIVIFTPLGFFDTGLREDMVKDDLGFNGAKWLTHRSGWVPEDFDDSWEILASESYYLSDALRQRLTYEQGAFWAIKTF